MKKIAAIVFCMAMLCMCFAGCGGQSTGSEDTIRIGIFEPASGANGAGGKQETLGVKYAYDKQPTVEIDGKTYKIELVEVDNQSADDKAVTAAADHYLYPFSAALLFSLFDLIRHVAVGGAYDGTDTAGCEPVGNVVLFELICRRYRDGTQLMQRQYGEPELVMPF